MLSLVRQYWPLLLGVVILGGGWYVLSQQSGPAGNVIPVEVRDITQEVNITGKVEPVESVDLAFERGGRVMALHAAVGDSVTTGEALASLDTSGLSAQYAQAQAAVRVQEAKLAQLNRGARPEELAVSETKVANAALSITSSRDSYTNILKDAFTKSDDAVRNKVDQFFSSPRSSSPQLNFFLPDSQLEATLETGRVAIESLLASWQVAVVGASFSEALASTTEHNLSQVKTFLDSAALAVNSLTAGANLSQTTIDSWKSAVSTARTNVNTAITNFLSGKEAYQNAQVALTLAQNEYAVLLAGATAEEIAAQEALLEEARASVQNLSAQLESAVIRSPLNGVVTRRDVKVGEIVGAGSPVVSVISDGSYEITANVPEADIAKILLNAEARVTLDAYSDDDVFLAAVVRIDPAETVIDGVSTYGITLAFQDEDGRIKSGMTADIDIVTGRRSGVVAIPFRNIRTEGEERVVYVETFDGTRERRVVKTGLRGSDGYVEILSGVSAGERIIADNQL